MSFTRTVPEAVPSLFQSSVSELLATKKSVPPASVICNGWLKNMFLTIDVPATVPSLRHRATPFDEGAVKKTELPAAAIVGTPGLGHFEQGRGISVVFAGVPSV